MNNTENITCAGKIIKSTGGLYTVERQDDTLNNGTIYECRAKGAFKKQKLTPLTGDYVSFIPKDDLSGFITDIKERKNSLIRPAVANVDLLIIVIAARSPDPDLFILDKLTAIAEFNRIETLLVINKSDLEKPEKIAEIYRNAGIDTVYLSAANAKEYRKEIDYIKERAKGKTTFFSGASGVGKTSLINELYSHLSLETGEISRKIERGKHTTRLTELFKIGENTYIGDTPGFGMVDVVGFNLLSFEGLLGSFPDIEKYACGCKYTDCTHVCEDGCSVMAAIKSGEVEKSRHESFVKLYNELKNVKPWDN